jgi:hypothetical protein
MVMVLEERHYSIFHSSIKSSLVEKTRFRLLKLSIRKCTAYWRWVRRRASITRCWNLLQFTVVTFELTSNALERDLSSILVILSPFDKLFGYMLIKNTRVIIE